MPNNKRKKKLRITICDFKKLKDMIKIAKKDKTNLKLD